LGKTLRLFHAAQVFHADLNAHNILIDANYKAYLIDFDRGTIRTGESWKPSNLMRLQRSLHKLTLGSAAEGTITERWNLLLTAYRQTSS
jgi:tRNA A-37 threonylcarbamoyl transferase component Bud32